MDILGLVLVMLNNNFINQIRIILKEKISVRGAPDFVKFFNSLDKENEQYKEFNDAFDLLKKDYLRGDKIPRDRRPQISNYVKYHMMFVHKILPRCTATEIHHNIFRSNNWAMEDTP